jgi:hypothetical protein
MPIGTVQQYYGPMPNLLRTSALAFLCLAAPTVLAPAVLAQTSSPADRLSLAKSLYYTPTSSGLKSFQCKASIDWKDLLTRFGAPNLSDDNPYLKYLNSVQLSVSDDLNGAGTLNWKAPTPMPDGMESSIGKMHDGMTQMLTGFFQSWNPYMNGGYIPAADKSDTVTANAEGIHVHGVDDKTTIDEQFDKNLLLTNMHVVTPELDVTAYPTYTETPNGRIISVIRSLIHQPPTAPAAEAIMSAKYSTVGAFQIPSSVSFEVKNVGTFNFAFSSCSVNTSEKSPMGL